MAENVLTSKTINEIIKEKFFVPDYQRGYRWTELQVRQLLDDIYDFINIPENSGKFYCLQPVVVTPTKDTRWEVIDGQQRLTTISIILAYLGQKRYELDFQTRPGRKEFLLNLGGDTQIDDSNIDYFHISRAFINIRTWFEEKEDTESTIKSDIHICLGKQVQIIWYEVLEEESDHIEIFTRLNIGKIPLTNAELIKALLLNDQNFRNVNPTQAHLEKSKIATEWDRIEQELHQEELWAYLNPKYSDSSNRIDFLFNIYSSLQGISAKNDYDVFDYFETCIKNGINPSDIWGKIKECFLKLKEWFNDREMYHLTGYLITNGKSLLDLCNDYDSEEAKKSDFKNHLTTLISNSIPTNIRDLDYGDDREKLLRVLLLFNIITIQHSSNTYERFSFYRFKCENWSLEHIHAQNSEGLNKEIQWKKWLEDHRAALKRIQTQENETDILSLITEIDELVKGKITQDKFEVLFNKIILVFEVEKQELDMHCLGNMALLDIKSNSSLNNSVFEVKRSIILERDKTGSFILPATKNVFLKYYTNKPDNLFYWTERDQKDYVVKVEETISSFLGRVAGGVRNERQ